MKPGRLQVLMGVAARVSLAGLVLLLLIPLPARAESSVWKLQRGEAVLYLGGTFHLLRQADFPPPPEFAKAYGTADLIVFETDIAKFNEPATHRKLMAKASYADGSSLAQHLSAQTYSLLGQYCAANHLPLTLLKQLRPAMVAVTLASVELAKLGVVQEGVDTYFARLAAQEGKRQECLETIDEQIDFLVGLGEGHEDEFIAYALKDLDSIGRQYGELVAAWRTGDAEKLAHLLDDDLKGKFPEIYAKLITERNANWLPRIEAYLQTPEQEFILVGAAHLVGPDGIIEALRRKGYKIEKL